MEQTISTKEESSASNAVNIRPANIKDGPRLTELSGQLGYPSSTATISARLSKNFGGAIFVGEVDGRVAGWVEVHHRQPSLVDGGSEAEAMGLVVDAALRRLGLGHKLMDRVEKWARTKGCHFLRVRTNVVREDAPAFYEKLGYKKIKTQLVYKKTLTGTLTENEPTIPPPWLIEEAEVILHLHVDVSQDKRSQFLDFCRRAFPIYESIGGNRMFLYEDTSNPGHFDEVGYYRTAEDYRRSEDAIKNDPVQVQLIREWRSLLSSPPRVTVQNKMSMQITS